MSALPVDVVHSPRVALVSSTMLDHEAPPRQIQTYETRPAMLDKLGRRIGWRFTLRAYPAPFGAAYSVTMQPLRDGNDYQKSQPATGPMSPDDATDYMRRMMRQALDRYEKEALKRGERLPSPGAFRRYDVLECSDDAGQTWQSFSTIRNRSDCAYAIAIVDTDGHSNGFAKFGRTFRVRCSSWTDGVRYAKGMRAPALPAGELP